MIGQWVRENVAAASVAAIAGTAVVGGATYYVTVAPAPSVQDEEAVPAIPPRFLVGVGAGAKEVFYCDLTVSQMAECRLDPKAILYQNNIILRRHPGDATRISVLVYGTRVDGITWPELEKGVTIGGIVVQAELPSGGAAVAQ